MKFPTITRFVVGVLTLVLGSIFIVTAIASTTVRLVAPAPSFLPLLCLFLALMFFVATIYLWFRAATVAQGEDIFSGERGLVVSLMIITVLVVGVTATWSALHTEFWVGMFEGMSQAARDSAAPR